MIRALAVVAALVPGMAQALSCMPHSIEAAYLDAKKSPSKFHVVRGTLTFDMKRLPKVDWNNQMATPKMTKIRATLSGKSFDGKGFTYPFNSNVTLKVACFGPWCAEPKSGKDVIAFVENGKHGPVVATDPCGGFLFQNPRPDMLRSLRKCHAGGKCERKMP